MFKIKFKTPKELEPGYESDLVVNNDHLIDFKRRLNKYIHSESIGNVYKTHTVVKDIIYLLGLSVDENKFRDVEGFNRFRNEFARHLMDNRRIPKYKKKEKV